ncbi:MAG: hypothetical protein AVDCRST_MAG90-3016, partial [uncultured Microvirga sp.]
EPPRLYSDHDRPSVSLVRAGGGAGVERSDQGDACDARARGEPRRSLHLCDPGDGACDPGAGVARQDRGARWRGGRLHARGGRV